MQFIADFHIHSKHSRACSKRLDLVHLNKWAQIKGIDLLATADFTHPVWFNELSTQLEQKDEGVYVLKEEYKKAKADIEVPLSCQRELSFIFSTEISLIYKKNGKLRRQHHVVLAPNMIVAGEIMAELDKRGNINSDGRPIFGMDSRDFLEMLLNISADIELIPAHVWTPHFALFGSKSGFDTVEECFEDLSSHIHALETGLSSDPLMNYRISKNDKYLLLSSSDAHSLEKLGREASIFDCEMSYPYILETIRKKHQNLHGTIEFYPEEGKYYADGIRSENLCFMPEQTKKNNYKSPNTSKALTVGVLHRIDDLADQRLGRIKSTAAKSYYIIPLVEILSEILGKGVNTKTVQTRYFDLLSKLGPEFFILKDCLIEEIERVDVLLAKAISRMRNGDVIRSMGYDGEFGKISLFKRGELL